MRKMAFFSNCCFQKLKLFVYSEKGGRMVSFYYFHMGEEGPR